MKEFVCDVKIIFSGNNFECENKQEYIDRVKNQFLEEFNLHLSNDEIINIEEIKS